MDPGLCQRTGGQLLRPKVANVVKWSQVSKASYLQPESRANLSAQEAFVFLMLTYAFSHILGEYLHTNIANFFQLGDNIL